MGASGYVGGELLRLLSAHPAFEIGTITAGSSAGDSLGAHHPHLPLLASRVLEETDAKRLSRNDIVFIALAHGKAPLLAEQLPNETLVVDLGADFRLSDPADWNNFYDTPYAGVWPYGFPEMPGAREVLKGVRRIATPGCFPTASTLAMMPAMTNGLCEPDVIVVAASGSSGAGRSAKRSTLGSELMGSIHAYGVGGVHRHSPEIRQNLSGLLGAPVAVSFTPMVAPMSRGILATCNAHILEGVTYDDIRDAYEDAFATEMFVTLLPVGQWPATSATVGSNCAQIQVALDESTRRLIAVCAIDNLTKGAAGNAIQSANVALGVPEELGLPLTGVAP